MYNMMLKSNIITIAAIIALTVILATTTIVVQMVGAQPSRDELIRNCNNGNAYACGELNGNPATTNPKSGTTNPQRNPSV